jgi:hypothetical protein
VWPAASARSHQHVDRQPDLGVHRDERAQLAGAQHRAEDLLVVDQEHAGVGHEHLEAGHALADHRRHAVEGRGVGLGHDHVEAVVDRGLALGLGVPGVEAGGAATALPGSRSR